MPPGSGEVSNTLIAQNLPEECTREMLDTLFSRLSGFEETRMVENRHMAFVQVSHSHMMLLHAQALWADACCEG